MISFKGSHYPKDIILYAVYFYVRYAVSYRDLEEIMAERGVDVDHATLNRWVVKYSPLIAAQAQRRKSKASSSWRMDETYIKIKGKWHYQYRAVDKHGKTLDFMLSERRDKAAARTFFINTINFCLLLNGWFWLIDLVRIKYLNNVIEQDLRFNLASSNLLLSQDNCIQHQGGSDQIKSLRWDRKTPVKSSDFLNDISVEQNLARLGRILPGL